jgi:hypothetical protein
MRSSTRLLDLAKAWSRQLVQRLLIFLAIPPLYSI